MDLVFRKLGNSTGLTFPSSFLREHGINEGQVVSIDVSSDGSFVMRPKSKARRYSAKELNEMCDFTAPMPQDLLDWEKAPLAGSEEI